MTRLSDEITTFIRDLHAQKVSDSTIALVAGVSEEAVADVLRPVKPPRPRPVRRPVPRVAKVKKAPPPVGPVATPPVKPQPLPRADTMPVPRLAHSSCRFIDGDPVPLIRAGQSPWCDQPVQPGSPYCPEHHGRCYWRRERKAS